MISVPKTPDTRLHARSSEAGIAQRDGRLNDARRAPHADTWALDGAITREDALDKLADHTARPSASLATKPRDVFALAEVPLSAAMAAFGRMPGIDPHFYVGLKPLDVPNVPPPLQDQTAKAVADLLSNADSNYDGDAFLGFARSFAKSCASTTTMYSHPGVLSREHFLPLCSPDKQVGSTLIDAHAEHQYVRQVVLGGDAPSSVATASSGMWLAMQVPNPGTAAPNPLHMLKYAREYIERASAPLTTPNTTPPPRIWFHQNMMHDGEVNHALFPMCVGTSDSPDETKHWILVVVTFSRIPPEAKNAYQRLDCVEALVYDPWPDADHSPAPKHVCDMAARNAVSWLYVLDSLLYPQVKIEPKFTITRVNGRQGRNLSCGLWVMTAISECFSQFGRPEFEQFRPSNRIDVLKTLLPKCGPTDFWRETFLHSVCEDLLALYANIPFTAHLNNPFDPFEQQRQADAVAARRAREEFARQAARTAAVAAATKRRRSHTGKVLPFDQKAVTRAIEGGQVDDVDEAVNSFAPGFSPYSSPFVPRL